MIDYIIKSAICLTVLLIVYHLFLENEKMHRFNRFFLLLSILAGLTIPLVTMETGAVPVPVLPIPTMTVFPDSEIVQSAPVINPAIESTITTTPEWDIQFWVLLVYSSGALIFLIKFVLNLVLIRSYISKHPRLRLNNVSVVLLPEDILPFSFLNYIFINDKDHKNVSGEQLFTHELAHVQQKHSLDILFVEILKAIFWFNPIFVLYKRAIQLNHEFLADDAVVKYYDVSDYQYLLVEKSIYNHTVELTSGLNYSVTKKRLLMMIKHSSGWKIWLSQSAMIPLMAVMLFLFSGRAVSEISGISSAILGDSENTEKNIFFKEATIWQKDKDGNYYRTKYEELNATKKASLTIPGYRTDYVARRPTKTKLKEWETGRGMYVIWIDDKPVSNEKLANYKPEDFRFYSERGPATHSVVYGKNLVQVKLHTILSLKMQRMEADKLPGKSFYLYKGALISPQRMSMNDLLTYIPIKDLNANPAMKKSLGVVPWVEEIRFPPPVVVPAAPPMPKVDPYIHAYLDSAYFESRFAE